MATHIDLETAAWEGDSTEYRKLDIPAPQSISVHDRSFLLLDGKSITALAREAFHDIEHFLRREHLEKIRAIAMDESSTAPERFVASGLLRNAAIAAEGVLPLCQDTGVATIYAWRGQNVLTPGGQSLAGALAEGAYQAWAGDYLRFSLLEPSSMLRESNSRTNLPAQAEIFSSDTDGLRLLFVAKGGGSSNKTFFFQETPAILTESHLRSFLKKHIPELGTSACPPYRLAIVVGGTSPEFCLTTLKLASTGTLDNLPKIQGGTELGEMKGAADRIGAFRCPEWELTVMEIAQQSGLGAQLGGKNLALDARVIRLPRHAASCPIAIGVSCNAHRNARALVKPNGYFLEKLETEPEFTLQGISEDLPGLGNIINLDEPEEKWLSALSALSPGDVVLLNGTIIVARDAAHSRAKAEMEAGDRAPEWLKGHPICYAGPAETPPGFTIGSFGPTTAGRMDSFLPDLMDEGLSLVTIAKGGRSEAVSLACARNGGLYLGLLGGAAALIASKHVVSSRIVAYPELGMEAVRLVEVRNLPAFVIVDSRGRELYPRPS